MTGTRHDHGVAATMHRRPFLIALFMLAVVAAPSPAQVTSRDTDVVDRIVAVVGDSVVLLTQVQEEVERLRLQSPGSVPRDAAGLEALQRRILDTWVSRLLVVQAAAGDSLVKVDQARVDEIVSQEIQSRARQYPRGQPELQEALAREGLTLSEYRDILANQVRQDQLQQMFIQRRLQDAKPVDVSEDELRQAFSEASGQLQNRPRLLTFEQVVMAPQPSDSAKARARAEAEAILDSIRAGSDFELLAKAHSDDTGSGEIGGDLGWFRRGVMVKEFEDAAFALADGQVSGVVETEFGFHIIKVERSRQGERKGRHILIRPTVGPEDVARARLRADSVVALARSGTPMAELFRRYSDPLAPDTLTVSFDQLDQLPPGYDAMSSGSQGQVVGPVEYDTGRQETRIAVLRIREIREAGAYTFEEVKPQLAEQVQRSKQMQRLLDELRARTHIEIRM